MVERGSCRVKMVDFGQARVFNDGEQVTQDGILGNIWYRAPELLLKLPKYDPTIDVWALGCVIAEMAQTQYQKFEGAMFGRRGKSELEVFCEQMELLGQPCDDLLREAWRTTGSTGTARKLFHFNSSGKMLRSISPRNFGSRLKAHPSFSIIQGHTLDESLPGFLCDLLAWNPRKRLTATKALEHQFFQPRQLPASTVLSSPVYPLLPQCTVPLAHVSTLEKPGCQLMPPPPPPGPPPLGAPLIVAPVPHSPTLVMPPSSLSARQGASSPELFCAGVDRVTTSANPDQSPCDSPHWKSCKSCTGHICCRLQGLQIFKTSNAVFPFT